MTRCYPPICLALVLLCLVGTGRVDAASEDLKVLDGLIARRLFPLAEFFCTTRLNDSRLEVAARGEFARGLIRVYAEQARFAPRNQRAVIWDKAQAVLDDFGRMHPDHPQLLLVRFQLALAEVARGEIAYEEFSRWKQQTAINQTSLDALSSAAKQLENLSADVAVAVRLRPRPGQDGTLTEDQLRVLQGHVRFNLIKVFQLQAEGFATGSPDRVLAAGAALEYARQLAPSDVPDTMWWEGQLRVVRCYLLKEDWELAAQTLSRMEAEAREGAPALELRAARIQLALAQAEYEQARQLVSLGREADGEVSAALDLAHLEASLAQWQLHHDANDESAAERSQMRAMECVQNIQADHDARAARLAVLMTAERFGSGGLTSDLEAQVHAAREFYDQGDVPRAIKAYDAASAEAQEKSLAKPAFELAYQAAVILHESGQPADAALRFRQAALTWPSQPRAADAHWIAVLHAARMARTDASHIQAYQQLLEEHVANWSGAESSGKAHTWLAQLDETQSQWKPAAIHRLSVRADTPDAAASVRRATYDWTQYFDGQQQAGEVSRDELNAAMTRYEDLFAQAERSAPAVADQALLGIVTLHVAYADTINNETVERLQQRLESDAPHEPEWLVQARLQMITARLAQHDPQATRNLAESVGNQPPALLLDWMERTMRSDDASNDALIAEILLKLGDAWPATLTGVSDDQQLQWRRLRAQSLVRVGKGDQALSEYAQLSEQFPDDVAIQQTYGQLLLKTARGDQTDVALEQWRLLMDRSRPGSDLWFEAKLAVAELHFRRGDKHTAAQLIRLLEAIYPELGGAVRRAQFRTLLAKCEST